MYARFSCGCEGCLRKLESERRRDKGFNERVLLKINPEDGTKECGECRSILSVEHFSPSSRGSLGVSSYCRACAAVRLARIPEDE